VAGADVGVARISLPIALLAVLVACHRDGASPRGAEDIVPLIETGALDTVEVGARVSVRGHVTRVQDDSPYGHKLWVDDGTGEAQVFVDAATELIRHTGSWRVADLLRIEGIVGKYGQSYELLPKTTYDIVVLER
jgi:hypothetical protein